MFSTKKTLIVALSIIAITGCITTDNNKEQQAQITNLKDSLIASQTLTKQTKSELESVNSALKISKKKITQLTQALEKSKKIAKSTAEIKHLDDKTILGQSEWVYISTVKKNYKGRIDTGAATSSINAVDIKHFERDGQKWVRFNLTHVKNAKPEIIEAKVLRTAKITQSSKPGVETERPVVKLHIRIGDVVHLGEFTLTNRLHMEYPVLIGRTFMQDVVLVDVSKKYIFPKYQALVKK